MTKEELEKEAEEYRKDLKSKFFLSEPQLDLACQGFKDGYNKANELHYVKDELPKAKTWVIGFYYGKDNWHKIFYRADGNWWGEGQLCQPPYAWKEIVLPELKE